MSLLPRAKRPTRGLPQLAVLNPKLLERDTPWEKTRTRELPQQRFPGQPRTELAALNPTLLRRDTSLGKTRPPMQARKKPPDKRTVVDRIYSMIGNEIDIHKQDKARLLDARHLSRELDSIVTEAWETEGTRSLLRFELEDFDRNALRTALFEYINRVYNSEHVVPAEGAFVVEFYVYLLAPDTTLFDAPDVTDAAAHASPSPSGDGAWKPLHTLYNGDEEDKKRLFAAVGSAVASGVQTRNSNTFGGLGDIEKGYITSLCGRALPLFYIPGTTGIALLEDTLVRLAAETSSKEALRLLETLKNMLDASTADGAQTRYSRDEERRNTMLLLDKAEFFTALVIEMLKRYPHNSDIQERAEGIRYYLVEEEGDGTDMRQAAHISHLKEMKQRDQENSKIRAERLK